MIRYFDSHAHYYDDRFAQESAIGADGILCNLFASCVSGVVNVGTNPSACRQAIAQAKRYPGMFTALGVHPTDCQQIGCRMDEALADIESLIRDPASKCVCLGEIGLDYHYPDTDRAKQLAYFHAQMELAESLGLPVSIHDRDAHSDTVEVLRAHPRVPAILHSFSGSAEMARALLPLDCYFSFSGVLTFTNGRRAKEAALAVPPDRLLIETDCPYLAPHPLRGSLNHSGNLRYTNATLAALLGMSEEDCAALTEANARRVFSL